MTDLVVNYFVDKFGKQTINLFLLHFDMIDRATRKDKHGKRQPIVPDVFGHIISNPELRIKREVTGGGSTANQHLIDFKTAYSGAQTEGPNKIEEEEKEEEEFKSGAK